jgi:3''-phosphoadenosine 5''-phosphosulfate sulfotransferase (PAPS reductase)/FAD synthetase and related enzymes
MTASPREVKLDLFERALREWQPDIWLNGIRRHQTEHRKTLDIFTTGAQHTVRVAPMFHLSELDVEEYIYEQGLPDNDDYFDPTKGEGASGVWAFAGALMGFGERASADLRACNRAPAFRG